MTIALIRDVDLTNTLFYIGSYEITAYQNCKAQINQSEYIYAFTFTTILPHKGPCLSIKGERTQKRKFRK